MISKRLLKEIRLNFRRINQWVAALSPEDQTRLSRKSLAHELARRSYIEGYWRIRETTPLIMSAIEVFNQQHDLDNALFWSNHLTEEIGHDIMMYRDLSVMYGSKAKTNRVLSRIRISPPSAAIVSYFHWQVKHNNPHLLMVYRLFLELLMNEMNKSDAEFLIKTLGKRATKTLALHRELDTNHVKPCVSYLNKYFKEADVETLVWSANLIGACLVESQLWIASQVLALKNP